MKYIEDYYKKWQNSDCQDQQQHPLPTSTPGSQQLAPITPSNCINLQSNVQTPDSRVSGQAVLFSPDHHAQDEMRMINY